MRDQVPHAAGRWGPKLIEQVRLINEEDTAVLNALDKELEEVRGQNHVLEAFKIKSDQLKEIADHLVEERKVVAKYEKIKWV